MEAKLINIDEWSYLGAGSTATSYGNKYDGKLFLKLNNKGYPVEATVEEYNTQRVFSDLGLPFPKVYDLVTDGERYGYTAERVKGKMSFARILSQEPERMEELCSRFTEMAKAFHSTPADTAKMLDLKEYLKGEVGDLSYVPADVAEKVKGYIEELGGGRTCLHGDLNPGNLICYEDKDYWIGANTLIYGDPYWDVADMYVLCRCTPGSDIEELYHMKAGVFKSFYDMFKKKYFGEEWNSPSVEERIRHAAMVKCCSLVRKDPSKARYIIPLIREKRLQSVIAKCLYGMKHGH